MFSGSIPALVTPFRDGSVDYAALRTLVAWQIEQGSSALVPCGTTGESATLSFDEHYRVIDRVIEVADGRVPVIPGCGSNDTATAVRHMTYARQAGAAASLVVCPYYNRPSQEGLYRHFAALADASDLPIILYNVPGRTAVDMTTATMARIARDIPTVVGIKESTGDIGRVSEIRDQCGTDFLILTGNDYMALGSIAHGARGVISVTANVAPALNAALVACCLDGDYAGALALQDRLYPLHCALFSDTSPGPTKYALSTLLPDFAPDVRLPIVEPHRDARAAVDAGLATAGISRGNTA